jgi:hypothetical protein
MCFSLMLRLPFSGRRTPSDSGGTVKPTIV